MLSLADYNHLKLLYDNFFKSNAHIRELILADDWDSVDFAVQEKDGLIRQIIFFEKARLKEVKENKELMALRSQLVELEKQNIELVKAKKEDFFKQIAHVSKAKKVLNTYEPTTVDVVSTFEVLEEG